MNLLASSKCSSISYHELHGELTCPPPELVKRTRKTHYVAVILHLNPAMSYYLVVVG